MYERCTGFIDQAPGCTHGMSLDMAGDFDEFRGEDYRRWLFKGGGGVGGIIKSVVVGAVIGAITGGIGGYFFDTPGFNIFGMAVEKGWQAGLVQGTITAAVGGALTDTNTVRWGCRA